MRVDLVVGGAVLVLGVVVVSAANEKNCCCRCFCNRSIRLGVVATAAGVVAVGDGAATGRGAVTEATEEIEDGRRRGLYANGALKIHPELPHDDGIDPFAINNKKARTGNIIGAA